MCYAFTEESRSSLIPDRPKNAVASSSRIAWKQTWISSRIQSSTVSGLSPLPRRPLWWSLLDGEAYGGDSQGHGNARTHLAPRGLLWLPAGVMATAVVRFWPGTGGPQPPGLWVMGILMAVPSLVFVAPCGLPAALATGLPAHGLVDGHRARRGHGGGTARADRPSTRPCSACLSGSPGGGWRAGVEHQRRRAGGRKALTPYRICIARRA